MFLEIQKSETNPKYKHLLIALFLVSTNIFMENLLSTLDLITISRSLDVLL